MMPGGVRRTPGPLLSLSKHFAWVFPEAQSNRHELGQVKRPTVEFHVHRLSADAYFGSKLFL